MRTRARAEKVVRDELSARQVEVFLPTLRKWSRWKDRKKAVDWPLFAGYCFARFDPEQQLHILKCPRVAGIVSFCGRLAPLPEQQIESLRSLVGSDLQYDPAPFIKAGDLVEVTYGPLKGVFGRLIRKGGRTKLFISIDIIAQGVEVEFDAADVRRC